MSSLVIVALPAEDDYVWKISSEKVPHLTLMYLGEVSENNNVDRMAEFVEHALNVSEHGPFYLDVEHRGELGDDKADVLFFSNGWDSKWIKSLRGQLLQQPDIRSAYEAADTFPDWVPHLTLGYPDAPAQEIEDDRRIYSVGFDRIAIWTGNYEGPEFRLKWPEREEAHDLAVAWSTINQARVAAGLEPILEHHGVKGMRWGVRKEQVDAAKTTLKKGGAAVKRGLKRFGDALDEHFYETSIYSSTVHESIHNQVADEIDAKVFKLQTAPKYRGKNLKTDHALKTEYEQDVAKVTDAAYRRAVKDHIGENTKRTKEARYVDDARGARIEIRDKKSGEIVRESSLRSVQEIQADRLDTSTAGKARHAADDVAVEEPDITIPLRLDDNGQIKGVGRVRSATAEHGEAFVGGLMHSVLELEHYGVKGMRWGVRQAPGSTGTAVAVTGLRSKEAPVAVKPEAKSKVPHGDKRKTRIEIDGGENHPATEDALKVAEAKAKLRKSGPSALTNQELREVAQRVQLEKQAVEATRTGPNKFIRKLFKDQGSQAVNETIREGVRETRSQVKDSFR